MFIISAVPAIDFSLISRRCLGWNAGGWHRMQTKNINLSQEQQNRDSCQKIGASSDGPVTQQTVVASNTINSIKIQGSVSVPPAYRMPPQPSPAEALPGAPHAATHLHTHSAKFPIEREVVVPCGNNGGARVREVSGVRGRAGGQGGTVAPDAPPPPAAAWTSRQEKGDNDADLPRPPRAVTRTYHTLRDMISSRFRGKDAVDLNAQGALVVAPVPALNNADRTRAHLNDTHVHLPALVHGINESPVAAARVSPATRTPASDARVLCADALYAPSSARRPHPHPEPRPLAFTSLKQTIAHAQLTFNSQLDLSRSRPDLRSPQQLEREMIRQRGLAEGRRAASHPHLLDPTPTSRGRPHVPHTHNDPDSDDGGFRARLHAQGRSSFEERSHSGVPHLDRLSRPELCAPGSPQRRRESGAPVASTPQPVISGLMHNLSHREPDARTSTPATASHASTSAPTGSGTSSDYDKPGGQSSNVDSGRGSVAYSSGRQAAPSPPDTYAEDVPPAPSAPHASPTVSAPTLVSSVGDAGQCSAGGDGEWVDLVENELRQILEPRLAALRLHSPASSGSSVTPPLPPLSPPALPDDRTRSPDTSRMTHGDGTQQRHRGHESPRWHAHKKHSSKRDTHYKKHLFGLDTPELTSTTTRSLDLSSLLDARSDSDVSAGDARAIRRQLRGLENMYAEVLQLLGVRKPMTRGRAPRPHWDGRPTPLRRYGSASSLPSSSASGRPQRDRRRPDHREKHDLKNINKRFQRLEAHVVTLARSVAHLSSEMRTQHLVVREMESVRAELAALRALVRTPARLTPSDPNTFTDPARVRRLTKFFGDEPPLMRLFLKRLGYEKYAHLLEREKVGAAELPYVGEERLRALGLPLGPRVRILREAGLAVDHDHHTTATTLAII